jgi:hypothetical protein
VAQFLNDTLGFNYSFVGSTAAIMAAFTVGFWLIFVGAVTFMNHNRR